FKSLLYQEPGKEAASRNLAQNWRVTTNAVIDFIALTRPYETFDPFVRFDRILSDDSVPGEPPLASPPHSIEAQAEHRQSRIHRQRRHPQLSLAFVVANWLPRSFGAILRSLAVLLHFIGEAYSTGERLPQGGITKTGNTHARRALIEGAWASRYPAKVRRPRRR